MKKKLLFLFFLIVVFFCVKPIKVVAATCPSFCNNSNCQMYAECEKCCDIVPDFEGRETFWEDITGKITNPVLPENLADLKGVSFLNRFAQTGISLGFVLGSLIFFFMLITGAIKYIAAGGDKGRLESGQKQITHALVGLVILFCVFVIIQLVETVFGISITKLTLPTL